MESDDGNVRIPAFGGGDRAWSEITSCVAKHFSPFAIEVVERRPAGGDFITVVIGGRASQLGLSDRTTNGVGPYSANRVIRNAIVHVFSKVGTGERDVANLCAVAVHEASHAMGLDHTYQCGDVMSYFLDRCGPRRLLDRDMPCGEEGRRTCGDGGRTQNSFRKLAAMVGLRDREPAPQSPYDDDDRASGNRGDRGNQVSDLGDGGDLDDDSGDAADGGDSGDDDDDDDVLGTNNDSMVVRGRDGYLYRVTQVRSHGRISVVVERIGRAQR